MRPVWPYAALSRAVLTLV